MSPAETINSYRVVPRIMAVFMMYLTHEISAWFMALPEPGGEQSAFAAAWVASAVAFFKFYLETPKRHQQTGDGE